MDPGLRVGLVTRAGHDANAAIGEGRQGHMIDLAVSFAKGGIHIAYIDNRAIGFDQ